MLVEEESLPHFFPGHTVELDGVDNVEQDAVDVELDGVDDNSENSD